MTRRLHVAALLGLALASACSLQTEPLAGSGPTGPMGPQGAEGPAGPTGPAGPGAPHPMAIGTYNIEAVRATTVNTGDSVKIQCGGSSCSAANPGYVVMNGATTAGKLTSFTVTSDVSLRLTGINWGLDSKGDLTGGLARLLYVNDHGTLRTCVAYLGGRHAVRPTDTSATPAALMDAEQILCDTTVVSAANTALEFGYVRWDFDDTGGAAENLFIVQAGINDVVTGQSADGLWQPWNPREVNSGWDSQGTSVTSARWTQSGRTIHVVVDRMTGVSDSAATTVYLPSKTAYAESVAAGLCLDNGTTQPTTLRMDTQAGFGVGIFYPGMGGGELDRVRYKAAEHCCLL